jgi:shikimate kinase
VNRNVILCGLPKSGKTTVGEALAKRLEMRFIDTDRCIELTCGKQRSCREIFIEEGEAYFRRVERERISNLAGTTGAVISLGGGALGCEEIERFVRSLGIVIYLNASLQEVWMRLMQNGIPAYVYPNNSKNREFANAESHRFDSEETGPLLDIEAVFSDSKMGFSAKAKTDSSNCLGIYGTDSWRGFESVAQQRIPSYERTAHQTIATMGLTIPQTVDLIVEYLEAAHGE